MPRSNHLPFLRPLYDIAVWQFILMIGAQGELKFTYNMHKVVANFVCKLIETRPFNHLQEKMMEDEVKAFTDNWAPGDKATGKLVEWCQDQWRRKEPCYPNIDHAYALNEPSTLPWFIDMPVCFNCGVPCPECRTELGLEIPEEMTTVNAILNLKKIPQIDVPDEVDCSEEENSTQLTAQKPSSSQQGPSSSTMVLRSSRKRK